MKNILNHFLPIKVLGCLAEQATISSTALTLSGEGGRSFFSCSDHGREDSVAVHRYHLSD